MFCFLSNVFNYVTQVRNLRCRNRSHPFDSDACLKTLSLQAAAAAIPTISPFKGLWGLASLFLLHLCKTLDPNDYSINMQEEVVIIVGAGPSGLATAACLSSLSIPYLLLEREDCFASLWQKYSYDRLHLHLRKQFCQLPHMSFPDSFPTYIPKTMFVQYLDDYVSRFKISPLYQRNVVSAEYDDVSKRWLVKAMNNTINACSGDDDDDHLDQVEEYTTRFLVVATGEATDPYTPDQIEGLETFNGQVLHSTRFKSGKEFENKDVLVVGSGNSGMEIAVDLANHGAKTSIIARSPVHTYISNIFSSVSNYLYISHRLDLSLFNVHFLFFLLYNI